MNQVIIVGGGLAGLSAAHTILERGGRVLVLDKNSFLGGNSTKATSGINGALTRTQIKNGVKDSYEAFLADTAFSAEKGKVQNPTPSELAKVLVGESASAVQWLQDKFNLDLTILGRLGGHSFPRTHRGKERFPGMTITYALMEKLEKICSETPNRAQFKVSSKVTKLISEGGKIVGVEYDSKKEGKQKVYGPVVIATGGFGADFGEDSYLLKVRPDLKSFSTTNGPHSTGDGLKMSLEVGAGTSDIEWIQVHPTGLVHPDDPNAKTKFLAAEALRGVGGILLNANGERFCNELGLRDYVTGEMQKNKGPFRLVLNGAASKEIEWHCKHYTGRGVMKAFKSGQEIASEMGISADKLKETFAAYNECAKNKKDPYGKKFFHNTPLKMDDNFHVAIVTPVVHYCMGGVSISPTAEITDKNGKAIEGLFAAGEVAGGIHGKNRLGGSSLLDCVVFGRVSGRTASAYMMKNLIDNPSAPSTSTGTVTGSNKFGVTIDRDGSATTIQVDPDNKTCDINLTWNKTASRTTSNNTNQVRSQVSSNNNTQQSKPAQKEEGKAQTQEKKEYTWEEIAKHNTEDDCWVVVHGRVLNVTKFLDDHPGGKEAIVLYAGKDATEEFDMMHDESVINKYAAYTDIGTVKGEPTSNSGGGSGEAAKKVVPLATSQSNESVPEGTVVNVPWDKPNNAMSLDAMKQATPGTEEGPLCGGTANVLKEERKNISFDIEKMTNVIDGSAKKTARRRFIISPTKDLDVSNKYYMSREDQLSMHVEHFLDIHEKYWGKIMPTREDVTWMSENAMIGGSLMNHYGLFLPTIQGQASPQQQQWWLMRALTCKIVGVYGQTELGHGSNVRGLQTVAEYDKSTQEFVLNTPTLRSMKWWPGTLGKVATHVLVYAQLKLDGKEYGVHIFMVQVRDENHRPLKGIELGDLGEKMGDHANDTGFMRLTNVRIPREHMLSKYQEVKPDGTYHKLSKKANAQIHYATMMFTRGAMVKMASGILARAATIAVRYGCVRTQGFKNTARGVSYQSEENKIIDYHIHRYRLLKQLSLAYAFKFTGRWMIEEFQRLTGDAKSGAIVNMAALPEIAATAAGLKGLVTFLTAQGVEDLRKCCGGNGYLLNSGIAQSEVDYKWQTTAEGDWIILMLQTARFLQKSAAAAMKGGKVSGPCDYLAELSNPNFNLKSLKPPKAKSKEQFRDLDYLLSLFRYRALVGVVSASKSLKRSSGTRDQVWNNNSIELVNSVRNHVYYFILQTFIKVVRDIEDGPCRAVTERLCALYANSNIVDDNWMGLITAGQVRRSYAIVHDLLDEIRPDAIGLVDAFDIPDRVLNSTIGSYDGNVYERLYESAKKSTLNRRDPFKGYHEHLRPRLDIKFLSKPNAKL